MTNLLDSPPASHGSSQMIHNFSYGAFGDGGRAQSFGYTGRWGGYTVTGNSVLNWTRWLSFESSRWKSTDKLGIEGGTNLFTYAMNNPAGMIDPFGYAGILPIPYPIPGPMPGPSNPGGTARHGRIASDMLKQIYDACTKSPSKCSEDKLSQLQDQVKKSCRGGRCTVTQSCDEIGRNMAINMACEGARNAINDQCFGGGDDGHRQAADEARNALKNCMKIYVKRCVNRGPK